jgi:AcrR family transcriptional regulator
VTNSDFPSNPPGAPHGGESAGASREAKKALQRQNILDAARQVFFRDGFVHANLDEVAQLAQVAKGTLYRYFENKGELYVAVLVTNGEIFEARMREAASSSADPAERIRRIGEFYYDHWTRNREYFQIFWALENEPVIGDLPPAVTQEVTSLWEKCLAILADVIRDGVGSGSFAPCDEWVAANVLWTTSNGMIQSETISSRRSTVADREPREVFEAMVEMMLRALRV